MNITDRVKDEIIVLNKKFIAEADDKFNFWEEHIKYVVKESLVLAKKYNADTEIVELAALLHDVALITKTGTSIEDMCVADADILAHFANIPMLLNIN